MENTRVYELQAEVYRALANPTRLMIIDCIGHKEKTVSEVVECLNLTKSNASQHLKYMRAIGILCSRKEGRRVYYYVSDKRLLRAIDLIKKVLFERFVRCSNVISEEDLNRLLAGTGLT